MGQNTEIQYAHHTGSPWIGCTKVSPGCANCYAEHSTFARTARKRGRECWGKGAPRIRTKGFWRDARRWHRRPWICTGCGAAYELDWTENLKVEESLVWCTECKDYTAMARARVFVSLCDWLDDEVPLGDLADFLKLMQETPNLVWILSTKRPENWLPRLVQAAASFTDKSNPNHENWQFVAWLSAWLHGNAPANIWLGVTAEDQARADERILLLLQIPARVRWVSVEPMLGPVKFDTSVRLPEESVTQWPIDWVVVGGESGPGARPCNVEWIRSVLRQCQAAGVPCFVKQLGKDVRVPYAGCVEDPKQLFPDGTMYLGEAGDPCPCGVRLKHPKGGDPAEWPEDLRVRELPKGTNGTNGTNGTRTATH